MSDRPSSDEVQPGEQPSAGSPDGDGALGKGVRATAQLAQMARHGKSLAITLAGIVTVVIAAWSQVESCGSRGPAASAPPGSGAVAERGGLSADPGTGGNPGDLVAVARQRLATAQTTPAESRMGMPLQDVFELIHRDGGYFVRMDMRNFGLTGASLPNGYFAEARAGGAIFRDAHLQSSDFTDARLEDSHFRGARLGGADFTGATLHSADFRDVVLTDGEAGAAQLPNALSCVEFSGVDFAGVDLAERIFITGSVAGADFRGADLSSTSFVYTDVTGADFSGASGLDRPYQIAHACARGEPPILPSGLEWEDRACEPFDAERQRYCAPR